MDADTIGRYRLVEKLGGGGMGDVYLARDETLDRNVALKVLPPELAARPERLERFVREAKTLAALDHPNIVTIYTVEEADGVPFLTMAYVKGRTLDELIPPGGLSAERLLELAAPLAEGLRAAHERGIIHRDLKPGNVMVDGDGRLRILDFGLAKLLPERLSSVASRLTTEMGRPEMTQEGAILGTYPYMAPEQAEGKVVDARSDIFSLGVVLYEMATGRRPFLGETPAALISSILRDEPRPLAEERPELPPRLGEVVGRCLEKEPGERFQTAGEVAAALSELVGSLPASAAADPDAARHGRTWPVLAALVSVVVVAALASLALLLTGTLPGVARGPAAADPRAWQQITFFPDSAVSPALSSDGRMLAFIRGAGTFTSTGQIYVKMLPGGEAVRLTDDSELKMGPVFSPDGSRIAYTVPWDTWEVPVLGGQARPWLPNASGLTWIGDRRILFSEVRTGIHMAIVTSTENRAMARDVYVPARDSMMAHRSYLSPDENWALVVEMETAPIVWLPCRLVPFDGSSLGRPVGPADSRCTAAAWSHDGRWMYFTADAGTGSHIWRQRFPEGEPEQITFGPTEEDGIVVAPDGDSLITAVGLRQSTVWVRDADGERQVSGEGDATLGSGGKSFSPDGEKLYFLKRLNPGMPTVDTDRTQGSELWAADLKTGRLEKVLSGFDIERYDLSEDGQSVWFTSREQDGSATLWIASLDRRTAPRRLLASESLRGGVGFVGNDVYFREETDWFSFTRMNLQGDQEKILADDTFRDGPLEGPWLPFVAPTPDQPSVATFAFPLDGGGPVPICASLCGVRRDPAGKYLYLWFYAEGDADVEETFVIPLPPGETLPDLPPSGLRSEEDLAAVPGVFTIRPGGISPGPNPELYAFTRSVVHRNLYRIPIPE